MVTESDFFSYARRANADELRAEMTAAGAIKESDNAAVLKLRYALGTTPPDGKVVAYRLFDVSGAAGLAGRSEEEAVIRMAYYLWKVARLQSVKGMR